MSTRGRKRKSLVIAVLLGGGLIPACSLGEGQGSITGTLSAPNCWSGPFSLRPDFYAGVPFRDSFQMRIQSSGDFETFSDGLSVLVDDVHEIRPDRGPGHLGEPLAVSLPPEVTAPGVPVKANPNPATVHLALYLQRTCRTQNVALYATEKVALNPDGSCGDSPGTAAIDIRTSCTVPSASSPPPTDSGSTAVGTSTITFLHLFNNDPEETNAAERLTEGTFDVYLADPREVCPGGLGPPPRCQGHLTGSFKFYFQRGHPGQPFP